MLIAGSATAAAGQFQAQPLPETVPQPEAAHRIDHTLATWTDKLETRLPKTVMALNPFVLLMVFVALSMLIGALRGIEDNELSERIGEDMESALIIFIVAFFLNMFIKWQKYYPWPLKAAIFTIKAIVILIMLSAGGYMLLYYLYHYQ